jgi:hypothetical protein
VVTAFEDVQFTARYKPPHLRSILPTDTHHAGRTQITRNKSHSLSQPRLPSTPYMHARHQENLPIHTRSPSPFLLEHKRVEARNPHAITKKDSFMNYDNASMLKGSPIWQPAPTKSNFVDEHAFSFEPSSSFEPADCFHNTQFTSHLLTTSSSPEGSPMQMPAARHHVRALQGWDLTSYDGLLNM